MLDWRWWITAWCGIASSTHHCWLPLFVAVLLAISGNSAASFSLTLIVLEFTLSYVTICRFVWSAIKTNPGLAWTLISVDTPVKSLAFQFSLDYLHWTRFKDLINFKSKINLYWLSKYQALDLWTVAICFALFSWLNIFE